MREYGLRLMSHISCVSCVSWAGCPSLDVDPQQVVKVDCDTHKDLMNSYKARGLPLVVIFDGGKVRPSELLILYKE